MGYVLVATENELQDRLANGGCRVAAGMTDMYPSGQLPGSTESVVDISQVSSLRDISCTDGAWRIGTTVRWSDVRVYPWPAGLEMLAEVASQVGAVQVQNAATVGGNLCNASPAADGMPVLLALGATVELWSARGVREMLLSDFITGVRRTALEPGEYLRAICFKNNEDAVASAFCKLGLRQYLVISIAMAAGQLRCDSAGCVSGISLALGACSPVATRLSDIEASIVGKPVSKSLIDEVTAERVASVISPIDDVRATAAYRRDAAVHVLRDTLARLVEAVA